MSITAIVGKKRILNSIHGFHLILAVVYAVEYLHVVILATNVVILEDVLPVLVLLRLSARAAKQSRPFGVVYNIWK